MLFATEAPSIDAVGMMASRINSRQDMHQDEIKAILMMRDLYQCEIFDPVSPGYIKKISLESIRILLYSAEQIRFGLQCL